MAREEPALSDNMKEALLHWFNTVGMGGCGGVKVESMGDLWKEHVPALLLYLKSECKNLKGARGVSALQVYEDAMHFMRCSTESEKMAANLNSTAAANGNELEISKFLLLFWHELCISDSKTIEQSIEFMELVNLQGTMGNAIEWMNKATENQDYNRWFHVLFESSVNEETLEDFGEAKTPVNAGDMRTPTGSADKSVERPGEDTFMFTTPSNMHMRHSLHDPSMRSGAMVTPRMSARRQLPVPSSEPRHFAAPRLPASRGSPIAEQLHSPAMREKRREREMRALMLKVNQAQEERDSKEIELNELKKNIRNLDEDNHKLKNKLMDVMGDLTKETRLRDEMEREMEGMRKEKGILIEKMNDLSALEKKWKYDYNLTVTEASTQMERIEELETKLSVKAREVRDLKDEVDAKRMALDATRDSAQKLQNNLDEKIQELDTVKEGIDEMNEDWRRKLEEAKDELMEIQMNNHLSIGEMNGCVMEKDEKLREVREELEKERKKGEEWKKESDRKMIMMREEMDNERMRMIDEMKEKKEKLERLEEEREKMDRESGEEKRDLMKKKNELDVKMVEMEGCNISLRQKLSLEISNTERLTQEVNDQKTKEEALSRMCEQLKGTIREMEKDREKKEAELCRLREVEKKNGELAKQIADLVKEKEEANEKAYSALLENDRFTAMIEKMKREEEERIKEEEWNGTLLRSEITTCTRDKEHTEEKLRNILKEIEGERKKNEEVVTELQRQFANAEEEKKNAQFILKNEMKRLKGLESELKKNEEIKKQYEELKDEFEKMKREHTNQIDIGRENMENVVGKKKELEMELEKRGKIIDKLNDDIARMKENETKTKETWNDTSMTTVKDDTRGTLLPQRTLMDFDEEPTQLYSKSNLSTMKEKEGKDYMEVNMTENAKGAMERISEDKENDTMFMMTPFNDRRQLAPLDSKKRVQDIASRNAKTLPHLRSSHMVEQLSPNFSQEALRDGVVRPSSTKKLGVLSRLGRKK
ncbi:hypothetical protein PMAYCL1PPCAC_06864 [Pristionchus mayeri]|uniref:Uncharacterized protein n=1 Tax=Pristionchus mayeri TaxID=1317129 RepID=A0AAN4ZB11_9BILA|nr:hypothetical protein PMAYCL1PPCAC_06864 [Pristionchus mayeri]